MTSKDIEHNIQTIIDNFSQEEFIYDFLIAYGISKTSVTRLKKGDFNLAKNKSGKFKLYEKMTKEENKK